MKFAIYFLLFTTLAHADGFKASGNSNMQTSQGLTDQDKVLSETFVHEGKSTREFNEECGPNASAEKQKMCDGKETKKGLMGLDPGMVGMVSKMYVLVIGMGGVGGTFDKVPSDKVKNPTKEDKEATDYCRFIPMASEAIGMFKQQSDQSNLSSLPMNQDTAQKDTLYRAAQSHNSRKKTAQIQATGFSATAACYATYATVMLSGGAIAQTNGNMANIGLKLAASGFLATFYWDLSKKHGEWSKEVKDIADRLPGKGDCNPITDRDCYCAQFETANDPQYCLAQMRQKFLAQTNYGLTTSCVDDQLKADPQCNCVANETCFDKRFMSSIKGLNFAQGLNQGFKPVAEMSRGTISNAHLNSADSNQSAIRQAMQNLDNKMSAPSNLSAGQLANAKLLAERGLPSKLAGLIASANVPQSAITAQQNKFQNAADSFTMPKYQSKGGQVLDYSGGDGLNKTARKDNGSKFEMPNLNKKGAGANSAQILIYTEEAQKQASISRSDRSIFEIISRRYQVSGAQKLTNEAP